MTEKNLTPRGAGGTPEIAGYGELLENLKVHLREVQVRAALAVNRELVLHYWQIGREILARQQEAGRGAKVIDRLSDDLRRAFPGVSGFSACPAGRKRAYFYLPLRRRRMALSIKNPETERLARKLARVTGENLTEAVTRALRDRLIREAGHKGDLEQVRADIRRIQQEFQSLPLLDDRTPEEIIGYDEYGLPS